MLRVLMRDGSRESFLLSPRRTAGDSGSVLGDMYHQGNLFDSYVLHRAIYWTVRLGGHHHIMAEALFMWHLGRNGPSWIHPSPIVSNLCLCLLTGFRLKWKGKVDESSVPAILVLLIPYTNIAGALCCPEIWSFRYWLNIAMEGELHIVCQLPVNCFLLLSVQYSVSRGMLFLSIHCEDLFSFFPECPGSQFSHICQYPKIRIGIALEIKALTSADPRNGSCLGNWDFFVCNAGNFFHPFLDLMLLLGFHPVLYSNVQLFL